MSENILVIAIHDIDVFLYLLWTGSGYDTYILLLQNILFRCYVALILITFLRLFKSVIEKNHI